MHLADGRDVLEDLRSQDNESVSMPASTHPTPELGPLLEIRLSPEAPVFRLHALGQFVCVERRTAKDSQREAAQYAIFKQDTQFLQWCDDDAIRLSFPLLHQCVRRAGSDLFASVEGRPSRAEES
jgi:hypothetical protein